MVKIAVILAAVAVLVFIAVSFSSRGAPLRGLGKTPRSAGPVLISRTRPPVAFAPAEDMRLQHAGWCDISPDTNISQPGDAKCWFALYLGENGVLVTGLLEATGDQWEWERGHHPPFPTRVLRSWEDTHNGETAYYHTMLLDEKTDPFWECMPEGSSATAALRMKFLLHFYKMEVIAEYHEPVPPALRAGLKVNDEWLSAFTRRGLAACSVFFPAKEEAEGFKETISKLDTLGKEFPRRRIGRWAGEMRRRRD